MAEDLTVADVEAYTKGRLSEDDPETERALNAALARVRRYCNWHVSPVRTETLTFIGEGQRRLILPTLKPVEIVSVTVGGESVDATLNGIMLERQGCWRGSIEVELSHGYPADDAEDFREAVLSLVDQTTLSIGQGGSGGMISKTVDDVAVRWAGDSPLGDQLAPFRRLAWVAA